MRTETNNCGAYLSNTAVAMLEATAPIGAPLVAVKRIEEDEWVVTYLDNSKRVHSSVEVTATDYMSACDRGWDLLPEGLEDFMVAGPGHEWSQEDLDRMQPYRSSWKPDADADYSIPGAPLVEHLVDFLDGAGTFVRRGVVMATDYVHACMLVLQGVIRHGIRTPHMG